MHVHMNLWIEAYRSLVYVLRVFNNLNIVWPTVQSDREISSERVMGGVERGRGLLIQNDPLNQCPGESQINLPIPQ